MMHSRFALVFLAACAAPLAEGPDAQPVAELDPGAPIVDTGRFQRCTDHPFTPAPDEDWNHTRSGVIAFGRENHSAGDILAVANTAPYVGAKLTYGSISKDLEDEDVLAYVDVCTGWRALGRGTTDDDGRVRVRLPPLPTGVYEVRFQVAGDRSTTRAYAWMLPQGTRITVTDIDATLTTSDRAVFQQILDGTSIPAAYPDAARLIRAHSDAGHIVLYLTGRPYWLSQSSRGWLEGSNFPRGALRVADSNTDILPTEDSVGAFKRAQLASIVGAGFVIDAAYGNATTDISAYLGAGITPDKIWIIGNHAGERGTNGVASWSARAAEVSGMPPVMQPFSL